MSQSQFELNPRIAATIQWNVRGSCGTPGCTDPECGCSLCGNPIGVDERDERWNEHDEDCPGCELCEDSIPIILFRGEGEACEQAQFHTKCFEKVIMLAESTSRAEGAATQKEKE